MEELDNIKQLTEQFFKDLDIILNEYKERMSLETKKLEGSGQDVELQ